MPKPSPITYFDHEGSENLAVVLRVIKKTLQRRPELRSCKLVFLTAEGRGPALAYNLLAEYEQKIIAVTFSPSFCIRREGRLIHPQISPKAKKFFQGVGIPVLTSRLPFSPIGGIDSSLSASLKVINNVFAVFGGSVPLAVQAILQACDMGSLEVGEIAIVATGDSAMIVSASSSELFLSPDRGLSVLEFLCKPRIFDITRQSRATYDQRAKNEEGSKAVTIEAEANSK